MEDEVEGKKNRMQFDKEINKLLKAPNKIMLLHSAPDDCDIAQEIVDLKLQAKKMFPKSSIFSCSISPADFAKIYKKDLGYFIKN